MRYVLLSKLEPEINIDVHIKIKQRIYQLAGNSKPKIGMLYINDGFNEKLFKSDKYFTSIFDSKVDGVNINKENIDISKFDIIHLPGANTFQFLYNLKISGYYEKLKNISNKLIIGNSAGSLILSETIEMALIGDNNNISLSDFKGLNLVDIEIFPHWNRWQYYKNELLNYTKSKKRKIYLIEDGEGVIINQDKIEYYGDIRIIDNGKYI